MLLFMLGALSALLTVAFFNKVFKGMLAKILSKKLIIKSRQKKGRLFHAIRNKRGLLLLTIIKRLKEEKKGERKQLKQ